MSAMPCLFGINIFPDHPLLQTILLKSIFATVILQGAGPVTSSNLESASDIHLHSQHWVFCSVELWLPFYCRLWFLHQSAWL